MLILRNYEIEIRKHHKIRSRKLRKKKVHESAKKRAVAAKKRALTWFRWIQQIILPYIGHSVTFRELTVSHKKILKRDQKFVHGANLFGILMSDAVHFGVIRISVY